MPVAGGERRSDVVYHVRAHPRISVEIAAECLIVAGSDIAPAMGEVTIVNLSIGGCQIRACPELLSDGCEVALRFGAMATVRGMVCWSTDTAVGVRFFEKLASSLLQHLVDTGRPVARLRSVA